MPEIFYARTRADWTEWLEQNRHTKREVWLEFPAKATGRESVSYSDAVEEAIRFGWIDSTMRPNGNGSHIQRFSVRNPKSGYSQLNRERLRWLDERGLLLPEVREKVSVLLTEEFVFPEDIIAELKKDPEVWKNYEGFSDSYKRIRIAYIDTARAYPEHFEKRLRFFIAKTRAGKLIVARGTEKYY